MIWMMYIQIYQIIKIIKNHNLPHNFHPSNPICHRLQYLSSCQMAENLYLHLHHHQVVHFHNNNNKCINFHNLINSLKLIVLSIINSPKNKIPHLLHLSHNHIIIHIIIRDKDVIWYI